MEELCFFFDVPTVCCYCVSVTELLSFCKGSLRPGACVKTISCGAVAFTKQVVADGRELEVLVTGEE